MPPAGRPRTFDRDAALTRAMHVFWEKGFEGTTMADLVKTIGVKAPSVYAAFGNKDAIFKEAVALYNGLVAEGPLKELKAPTIYEAVKNSLHKNVEFFTNPATPSSCLVMSAAINCAPENKGHVDDLRQNRAYYKDAFRQRFELAIKDGQLLDGADAKSLAEYFTTFVQGMAIRAKDGSTKSDLMTSCGFALSGLVPLLRDAEK